MKASTRTIAERLSKLLFHVGILEGPLDGLDLDRLAHICGCTRRTLYRDMAALRSAGFKLPDTERRRAA
jgi:predicted DNA-binding transcriptional regulator YafY